jgi:lipopolysaccharide biosynthesis glycosyltransferase
MYNLEQSIEIRARSPQASNREFLQMDIVFAVDDRYAQFIAPQLMRLSELNNKASKIWAIVSPKVSPETRLFLTNLAEQLALEFEIREVNVLDEFVSRGLMSDRTHVSSFTYVKIFLPEILDSTDEILYLDVDIWINRNIAELLNWRLTTPIGAVPELGRNGETLFGKKTLNYFNAGVLRMSLRQLRQLDFTRKAITIIEEHRNLEFQDQDVMNLVMRGRFDHLPPTFNVFNELLKFGSDLSAFSEPTIVHFNGPHKPWNSKISNKYALAWIKAFEKVLEFDGDGKKGGGLRAEFTNLPSSTPRIAPQVFIADAIYFVRQSPLGVLVRGALPYKLKKRLNNILYRSWSKRDFHELLDQALFANLSKKELKTAIGTKSSQNNSEKSLGAVTASEKGNCKFIFVLSQPRSGTTAFQDIVGRTRQGFVIAGELFNGYLGGPIADILRSSFPWIQRDNPKTQSLSPREFKALMEINAKTILQSLQRNPKLAGQTVVVKIFPSHLSYESLIDLLAIFRPDVIIMRRVILYTFLSRQKARSAGSGAYTQVDSSDRLIEVDEREISSYITNSDVWFSSIKKTVESLKLVNIDITYSGIFETGEELPVLEKFLSLHRGDTITVIPENTGLTIQDRRKDYFLTDVMGQYSQLTESLRGDLIRLPSFNKHVDAIIDPSDWDS